jgi:hypothetical protein
MSNENLPVGVTTGDIDAQDAAYADCDWCGREYRRTENDSGLCPKCEHDADKGEGAFL